MNKFKVDHKKRTKVSKGTLIYMDPILYRWVKLMAVTNDMTITSVLNQAIEYAKKNSERISI